MNAAVLHEVDGPLRVEDVELRAPAADGVLVRIAATGVCHSDLSVQRGLMPLPLPCVLGHEGAGIVEEVGAAVRTVRPGDHVILSPMAPCRRCFFCLRGRPELCEHGVDYAFVGPYADAGGTPLFPGLGPATFAERTVLPEAAVVPIDPAFPLEIGALIGCGVVTGVGAVVNSARVEAGATVAVIGCGGVGLAAIQAARMSGASRIVALDRAAGKLPLARECGATDTVDASETDPVAAVRDLTGGLGVDHALEVVGLGTTIEQAYQMTRRAGTVTVVGAGSFDDGVSFTAMQLMVDAKTVRGCVYGAADPARDFPRLMDWQERGLLDLERLVTRHIALDEIDDAFADMVAGEGARAVVTFE